MNDRLRELLLDAEALIIDLYDSYDLAHGHDDEDDDTGSRTDEVLSRLRGELERRVPDGVNPPDQACEGTCGRTFPAHELRPWGDYLLCPECWAEEEAR